MGRITKYLLLVLIVAVAFNNVVKAQEEEATPVEEAPAEEAEGGEYQVGSIKKIGSWLSKFGWWNVWKGFGLKKIGDWWKWDKLVDVPWAKKLFLLGSPAEGEAEEESRIMLVLSNPDNKEEISADEEEATYFLAPPGFENELAKRGIAINSLSPEDHQKLTKSMRNGHRQNYEREVGQASDMDVVRVRPDQTMGQWDTINQREMDRSLSRRLVESIKKEIPEIIPLAIPPANPHMWYAHNQGLALTPGQYLGPTLYNEQMPSYDQKRVQDPAHIMTDAMQNPVILQEYEDARKPITTKQTKLSHANTQAGPDELVVKMDPPKGNTITTKESIERALNDDRTQKMLEQYVKKHWKDIKKDAIILKFVPQKQNEDLTARSSVKRQTTMAQDDMNIKFGWRVMDPEAQMQEDKHPRQMTTHMADQHQQTQQQWQAEQMPRQMTQEQQPMQLQMIPTMKQVQQPMQWHIEQTPRQMTPSMAQEQQPVQWQIEQMPRQMAPVMAQDQQPMQWHADQMPRQMIPNIDQQPMHWQFDQTPMIQQEPQTQGRPRHWIQDQPQMLIEQQQEPRHWIQEAPQTITHQEQPAFDQMPRHWIQEQPQSMMHDMQRQMLPEGQLRQIQTDTGTVTIPDEATLQNNDQQMPIVAEMEPQIEEHSRSFKKAKLLSKKLNQPANYETHNYNIYASGGYGGGSYGGYSTGGYGSGGYGSGGYGGNSYGHSHGGGYGGGQSYGHRHGGGYGGGQTYGGYGYRSTDGVAQMEPISTRYQQHQDDEPNQYRSTHPKQHNIDDSAQTFPSDMSQQQQERTANKIWNADHQHQNMIEDHEAATGEEQQQEIDQARLASKPSLSSPQVNVDLKSDPHQSSTATLQRTRRHNFDTSPNDLLHVFSVLGSLQIINDPRRSKRQVLPVCSFAGRDAQRSRWQSVNDRQRYTFLIPQEKGIVNTIHRECDLDDHRSNFYPDMHRSKRQASRSSQNQENTVPYSGNYGTIESIPAESLYKLRAGYKDALKEITLRPDEDPTEALLRYNADSIREAFSRASMEPIEVDSDMMAPTQPRASGALPASSENTPSYQSAWPRPPPIMAQNMGTPMVFKNGNFYPSESSNESENGDIQEHSMTQYNPQRGSKRQLGPLQFRTQPFAPPQFGHSQFSPLAGSPSPQLSQPPQLSPPQQLSQPPQLSPPQQLSQPPQLTPPQQLSQPPQLSTPPQFFQSPQYGPLVDDFSTGGSSNMFAPPQRNGPMSQQFQYPPQQEYGALTSNGWPQMNGPIPFPSTDPRLQGQPQFNGPMLPPIYSPPNYRPNSIDQTYLPQFSPTNNGQQTSTGPRLMPSPSLSPSSGNGNMQSHLSTPNTAQQIQTGPEFIPPAIPLQRPSSEESQSQPSPTANTDKDLPTGPTSARIEQPPDFETITPTAASLNPDVAIRDYLGDELLNPTVDSFRELLEAIKSRLTSCCHRCKDRILQGITSNNSTANCDEACTTCTEPSTILTSNFISPMITTTPATTTTTTTTTPVPSCGCDETTEVTYDNPSGYLNYRTYRQKNSVNFPKITQQKSRSKQPDDIKPKANNHDNSYEYDYYFDSEDSRRNPLANGYQQLNIRTGLESRVVSSRSQPLDQVDRIRPRYEKPIHDNNPKPARPSYAEHIYTGVYNPSGASQSPGNTQANRRLISRSGPKEIKETGYDYEKQKQKRLEHAMRQNDNSLRTPKQQKVMPSQQDVSSDTPCKKIHKQIKELETITEKMATDGSVIEEGEVEKKAKMIELLYFLYELSKCSRNENPPTTTVVIEVSTKPSVVKGTTESFLLASPATAPRKVKIPKRRRIKTVDNVTVREADRRFKDTPKASSSNKENQMSKRVESLERSEEAV